MTNLTTNSMIDPKANQISIVPSAKRECIDMLTKLGIRDEVSIYTFPFQIIITFKDEDTATAFIELFTE